MKTLSNIIYEWVASNYGQSEADNPSWDIKALAGYISKQDIKADAPDTVYAVFVKIEGKVRHVVLFKNVEEARKRVRYFKQIEAIAQDKPNQFVVEADGPDRYEESYYRWESKADGTPYMHLLEARLEIYVKALNVEGD